MASLLTRAWGGLATRVGSLRAGRMPALGWPTVGPVASMAFWKSANVRSWVETQDRKEFFREPYAEGGKVMAPLLSARRRAMRVKIAIKAGELKLEPTVMVEAPYFKGHKRDRRVPIRKVRSLAGRWLAAGWRALDRANGRVRFHSMPHARAPAHVLALRTSHAQRSPPSSSPRSCAWLRDSSTGSRSRSQALVEQKMAEMPKLLEEYRAARTAAREKKRAEARWK